MKTIKIQDKVLVSSGEDFFDDCPICQEMRKAEQAKKSLDPVALATAFNKAKEHGAVVKGFPQKNKHD